MKFYDILPFFCFWLLRVQIHIRATGQANKLRDELLGQEIATLFRKLPNWEDSRLMPKNHLARIRIQAAFIPKVRGGKVRRFLVPISLQRTCVNFFLPAVIHRWAWSGSFLWAKQRHLSLMLITWKAGFPEMGHYIWLTGNIPLVINL